MWPSLAISNWFNCVFKAKPIDVTLKFRETNVVISFAGHEVFKLFYSPFHFQPSFILFKNRRAFFNERFSLPSHLNGKQYEQHPKHYLAQHVAQKTIRHPK